MLRLNRMTAGICLVVLLTAWSGPLAAQPPTAKKVLAFSDSDIWRTSSQPVLSPDGTYVAYAAWVGNGDGEAIVRHIASGKDYKFPRGGGIAAIAPKFTPDSKFALVPLTPTKTELDKAKADKADTPQSVLAVINLSTGQIADKFPQAGVFSIAGEGAGFVVYRKPTPPAPKKVDEDEKPPTGPMGGKGGGKGKGTFTKGGNAPSVDGEVYGTELHIRDLASKNERIVPEVSQFSLSKDGQLLVYTVTSRKEETNGVYAVNPRSGGSAAAIKLGPGKYTNLTWDEKQTKLAFLYDSSTVGKLTAAPPPRIAGTTTTAPVAPAPKTPPQWHAYVWDRAAMKLASPTSLFRQGKIPLTVSGGFAALGPAAIALTTPLTTPADEVLGPKTPGQRPGWTLTSGSLSFSADGTRLYVNTAPVRTPPPSTPPATDPDDFQLDLWHWQDARLQPMQKLQATSDLAKTYSGVILLDSKQFRQLSDDTLTVGTPPLTSDWALGSDDRKYIATTGYGLPLRDYAAVNVRTGERKVILSGFGGYSTPPPSLSPTGKHLVGFDGKDWFSLSLPDGKKHNLTTNLKEKFFDEDDDHPGPPSPAGQPLWSTDGKFVLINDRYDLWKLAVDGSSAENLTRIGRGQQIRFILLRVPTGDDEEPQRGIDLSKPHLLSAENLYTRDTGFYRLEPGAAPKLLVMGAHRYGFPDPRQERGRLSAYRADLLRFPRLLRDPRRFPRTQTRHRPQPAHPPVQLGQGRTRPLSQYRRQAALRRPRQAGELRSREKVPDDGLHLRAAVQHGPPLPRAVRHPRPNHQPHLLRQQRLPRADAGHRLQDRYARPERAQVRAAGDPGGRR